MNSNAATVMTMSNIAAMAAAVKQMTKREGPKNQPKPDKAKHSKRKQQKESRRKNRR